MTLDADPGFGRSFTSHMASATWSAGAGWSPLEVGPADDLALSPAALVLHYAQAIFEGSKAFRQPDGSIALFRPKDHGARFNRSAVRMAMPELDPAQFVEACKSVVRADADAVPSHDDHSLYLRPVLVATEAAIGVRPSSQYLFFVIASPVGSYFAGGRSSITVWVTDRYVRAAPGGTGAVKCAANYAMGLAAKQEAGDQGCDEVLFLDAVERRWLEELGGMNVAAVEGSTLVTPPLGDTILPGVTRDSLLQLAPDVGLEVSEQPIAIDDVMDGRFDEVFACGTAAVVAPISEVVTSSGRRRIGDGEPGPIAKRLRDELTSLQRGRSADRRHWLDPVTF